MAATASSLPTIVPLECGWLTAPMSQFEEGADETPARIPVPAWLIRHPKGDVLFDTGMHPELMTRPERLGGVEDLFTIEMTNDDAVSERLALAEIDPAALATVVLSHLHFDHVGGLELLPNARIVVQRDEWEAGQSDLAPLAGYTQADYDHGHDPHLIDGDHDLYGDGSIVCLSTPGHTAGHQSLRVETAGGAVVLSADACYFDRTLDGAPIPGFSNNPEHQRASLDRLRVERAAGCTVIPGHDPAHWARLANVVRN